MTRLCIAAGLTLLVVSGCTRPQTDSASFDESTVALLRTAMGGDKAAGPGPAVAAPEPTGWATLRGRFILEGNPPPKTTLTITADHAVCQPGGAPVYGNDVVIGEGGGLKNVVVYLFTKYPDGDPKWEHPEAVAAKANPPDFDQKQCVFLTHVFTMRASATLKVLNSDPVGHNTNIAGGGGAASANFNVPAGASAVYQPGGESAEPFKVACNIHPWMAAYGLVRKSPYFAVTNDKGEFELKNLPAGVPLEIRVWQEKSRFNLNAQITGEHDKFTKGRLSVKLANDEQRELGFTLSAKDFGGN
jgi:hypothetical protein